MAEQGSGAADEIVIPDIADNTKARVDYMKFEGLRVITGLAPKTKVDRKDQNSKCRLR